MALKLGVNIDHVATLRQARREVDPDPVVAARVARGAGADLIVTHLRQDRRHIQEADLQALRKMSKTGLHMELANAPAMIAVGLKIKPDSICIVPESAQEVTTQGGLNLKNGAAASIGRTVAKLKKAGIEVSLFVDPDAVSVRTARNVGADAVELCTSAYAKTVGKHLQRTELEKLELAAYLAHELGLDIHAGHGLDYHNVGPIAEIPNMGCLNIGFSIVARSVFVGFRNAVAEMKKLIVSAR
ncbi:MAG TPA: pyridoxine 5'-phosphate synthase [Elusimicrobiota bacterium]|jgi:pyridoxine 5-phosphate synthase|nr:pyridoxine 5'-phosphate synthase [Elusimicrobiota bacterium]